MPNITAKKFILIAGISAALACAAGCRPTDEDLVFTEIFSSKGVPSLPVSAETFVFWVNGDADHFVAAGTDQQGNLIRGDAAEVKRLDEGALKCGNCNVFVFHEQRGGSRWYTADKPWAAYLRIFSAGKMIAERHVPGVNGANPHFLAAYLQFVEKIAPHSKVHLIYRGHSFQRGYDPKTSASDGIAPFVYSNPESPYGVPQFTESLRLAGLREPLMSITLAACSMAYMETAEALAPFTHTLIASEVDFLETLDTGADYSWLARIGRDSTPAEDVIAQHLMDRFDSVPEVVDAMMEYPMTEIDLDLLRPLLVNWKKLLAEAELPDEIPGKAGQHVERRLSERYLNDLKKQGKPEEVIHQLTEFIRGPSEDAEQLDVSAVLNTLPEGTALGTLKDKLSQAMRVYRNPPDSGKLGISFDGKINK